MLAVAEHVIIKSLQRTLYTRSIGQQRKRHLHKILLNGFKNKLRSQLLLHLLPLLTTRTFLPPLRELRRQLLKQMSFQMSFLMRILMKIAPPAIVRCQMKCQMRNLGREFGLMQAFWSNQLAATLQKVDIELLPYIFTASFKLNNVMFSDAFCCKLVVVSAFGSILVFQNPSELPTPS